MNTCSICGRELNTSDPLSLDCGGDCILCMADYGEDPECIQSVYPIIRNQNKLLKYVLKEIKQTLEHANSTGLISDTIWMNDGRPETLFDYIDSMIEKTK